MEMKVYSEKMGFSTKLGGEFGAGDDAQPFIGTNLLSVADGMGGSGAQPVISFCPSMAKQEESFDKVMKDCLPKGHEEDYRTQYDENFAQLYKLGTKSYEDMGGRHSSYFGSRIVSILVRAALEEAFNEDGGVQRIAALAEMDKIERENWLSNLEVRLKEWVGPRLKRVINHGKLEVGKSNIFSETNLMGTTYSGIVWFETENCVHAICIQAGDSLPWAILVRENSDGEKYLILYQLMQAQESESGGITNFIGPNNDEFYLRCKYFSFKKPCAILTASDGAFDFFQTTIHFEHFLMYKLMQSNDLDDCATKLGQYYAEVNTNDDSSTIAFKAFGFEDYSQIQQMANRRQIKLNEDYSLDNDLLYSTETSPEYRLDIARMELTEKMKQFQDDLWDESPSLRKAALVHAKENNATRMQQIEQDCREVFERRKKSNIVAHKAFIEAVRSDWLIVRASRGLPDIITIPKARLGIFDVEFSVMDKQRELRKLKEKLKIRMEDIQNKLMSWQDEAIRCKVDAEESEISILEKVVNCIEIYGNAISEMQNLLNQLDNTRKELNRAQNEFDDLVEVIEKMEAEEIEQCASDWERHPERVLNARILPEEKRQALHTLAQEVAAAVAEMEKSDIDADTQRIEYARQVYKANPTALINLCMKKHKDELSESLMVRIEEAIAPEKEAIIEARKLIQMKKDSIDRYNADTQSFIAERG